jgi:molybdopterin molybdotransferase
VWGDGLVDNPPQQAIRRGDMVRFVPFSELLELKQSKIVERG